LQCDWLLLVVMSMTAASLLYSSKCEASKWGVHVPGAAHPWLLLLLCLLLLCVRGQACILWIWSNKLRCSWCFRADQLLHSCAVPARLRFGGCCSGRQSMAAACTCCWSTGLTAGVAAGIACEFWLLSWLFKLLLLLLAGLAIVGAAAAAATGAWFGACRTDSF
jgi:hypothetical protein